jgi:FlaA1/EpsC-like NDP-sugar epimerase
MSQTALERLPQQLRPSANALSPGRISPPGLDIAGALLGRELRATCSSRARTLVQDRTVLVTGAGGSIGSELVRQLGRLGARKVVCLDRDEYALYRLQLGLTGSAMLADDSMVLADVASRSQVDAVFAQHRPGLVFHAAACKQLPLLERAPAQAILTNVLGTMNVADLAAEYGAERFVNISTDKAARPVSVLGMTKRLAELATAGNVVGADNVVAGTRSASVRFGNVFASRGSFIETLAHQIAAQLPVTITDLHMTRFFMTIPQAVGLVIEAAAMADGRSIFMLDMGESHSIVNIARRYAMLAGVRDVEIVCTGRRAGEKLDEELSAPGESCYPTDHEAIKVIPVELAAPCDRLALVSLVQAARAGASPDLLRRALAKLAGAGYAEAVR